MGQHGGPGAILHMPENFIVQFGHTNLLLLTFIVISLIIQAQLNIVIMAFEFYGIH